MTRRTRAPAVNATRHPLVEIEFRPYVAPAFVPPRPGSMRHLELPSLAGGQRYYPQRPWAAKDQ